MTEKVFYQDSYQKTLNSEVVDVLDNGVVLAATIFYPLGGGQPGDTGRLTINGRDYRVVDTRYAPDRVNIVHFLEDDDLGAIHAGDPVGMEIDWERRHRLMRMHTSMHLVCSLISAQATGGAVGETESRLDFDLQGEVVDKEKLTADLNALVAKAIPVKAGSEPGAGTYHVGTAATRPRHHPHHHHRGHRLSTLRRHPRAQYRRDWRALGYRSQEQGQAEQAHQSRAGGTLACTRCPNRHG
jgi:Ser-tRNA(Ala) deacylase AlaX